VVSLPRGGGHRRALVNEASAGASAALAQEQLARFDVAQTTEADVTGARTAALRAIAKLRIYALDLRLKD